MDPLPEPPDAADDDPPSPRAPQRGGRARPGGHRGTYDDHDDGVYLGLGRCSTTPHTHTHSQVYRRDPRAFDRLARQHTARHATAAAASGVAAAAEGGQAQQQQGAQAGEEEEEEGMQGVTTVAGAGGDDDGGENEGEMKVAGGAVSGAAVALGEVDGEGAEMEEGGGDEEEEGARRWDSDVSICGEADSCSTGSSSSFDGEDGGGGMGDEALGRGVEERKRGGGGGGKGRPRARRSGGGVGTVAMEPELFVVSAEGLPPAKRARRR